MKYGATIAPAAGAVELIPDDATFLRVTSLYVGTGGDIAVEMENGDVVTFIGVPSGTVLPIRILRLLEGDTDAEDIIGLKDS